MHRTKYLALAASALALSAGMAVASPDAMDAKEARHLLSRTGFGAAPHEIEALIGKPYDEAVADMIAGLGTTPSTPMPAWTGTWAYPRSGVAVFGQTAEELFFTNRYFEIEELSAWWLGEMVATPSPLTEKLVLFWHDHFATSFDADEDPHWMANQNRFFRQHAAGNFRDLAMGILQDPAMLSYLSNTENFRDAPNENLGREFLELFTLGEGRGYSETDVKETARALTGNSVSELDGGAYAFFAEEHDNGRKSVLGQSGRFDGQDLAGIVTSDPNFGPYIVEKLWLQFVSDTPDPDEVARLTGIWKANDLDLKPLLHAMFLTDAFWAEENRGRLVKSPVELIVGAVRTFGPEAIPLDAMSWAATDMGQELFFPPNVGGWPSGSAWINDATAVSRATMMTEMLYLASEAEGEPATQMMAERVLPTIERKSDPNDLRVGQVFALEAEKGEEDGPFIRAFLVLFDVSFAGQTFRSLPIFIEQFEDEVPEISLYVGDCAPACLFGASPEIEGEEPWVWLPVSDDFEEVWEGAPDDANDFLASLTAHLPDLLDTTRDQVTWTPETREYDEDTTPASFDEIAALTRQIAEDARDVFGAPEGQFLSAFSRPNALGLEGLDKVSSIEDVEEYYEAREDTAPRFAQPTAIYTDLGQWIDAIPSGSTISDILIAGDLITVDLITADPDSFDDPVELIEALILSPEFQLN